MGNNKDINTLEDVYSAWQNNPEFREEFKRNPEKALADAGMHLSDEDLKKIESMLNLKNQKKSNDNDELEKRINK